MMGRDVSFSAAATTIPPDVIERVRADLRQKRDSNFPLLDLPFSSADVCALMADAEMRLRTLLDIPSNYAVLFSQGGAYAHFSMVAMNLLADNDVADYVDTGLWAKRAIEEAAQVGRVSVIASGDENGCRSVPPLDGWRPSPRAAYRHITSNESAQGIQFQEFPAPNDVPLVADMTGDFLTRPINVRQFGLIYASAQKCLGAAGLTLVIVRRDLLRPCARPIPAVFDYHRLAAAHSRVNTPPIFAIYLAGQMLRWIEDEGGLAVLAERRARRCDRLYRLLGSSRAFRCSAAPGHRSATTLCFSFAAPEGQSMALEVAASRGLRYLEGHPAVGGFRIAIHNAHTDQDIERIADYLEYIST